MHGIRGGIASHFEIGVLAFIAVAFVLGFFMSLGKAAVFKHVATYYPDNVGAVGGLVGMIGGLGGFFLPVAFGVLNDVTGLWSSCFMLLFALVAGLFVWMDISVRRMERRSARLRSDLHLCSRMIRRSPHVAEKLVIVGNGMAPGRMLEHLLEAAPGRYDVTIFNAEPRVNYDRIMLSPVLAGEKTLRADRHPRRRLVRQERHHALQGRTRSSRSTARPRPCTSRSRRDRSATTSSSSPPARRPSSSRCPARPCRAC